jgi:hypothetical protein
MLSTEQIKTKRQAGATWERRGKPRIYKAFHVNVRGVDINGQPFDVASVLDNLSSTGIYLRLAQEIELGEKLSMIIRLSTSYIDEVPVAKIAVEGSILRKEPLPDGMFGFAIAITKHRFIC